MFCSSFCKPFFLTFLLQRLTANLQKVLFFKWFCKVFAFRKQRPHNQHPIKIVTKICFILGSKIGPNGIGNRSSNWYRLQHRISTVLGSILGPIWGPFWELWASKWSNRVKFFDVWYSACSVFGSEAPRRPHPEPFWDHFGSILEPFLERNWYRNSPIQTNNATIEQANSTTTQQTNNLTLQQSDHSKNHYTMLATRWLDPSWWGSAKRKQFTPSSLRQLSNVSAHWQEENSPLWQ